MSYNHTKQRENKSDLQLINSFVTCFSEGRAEMRTASNEQN
jgi:hypothetical protein